MNTVPTVWEETCTTMRQACARHVASKAAYEARRAAIAAMPEGSPERFDAFVSDRTWAETFNASSAWSRAHAVAMDVKSDAVETAMQDAMFCDKVMDSNPAGSPVWEMAFTGFQEANARRKVAWAAMTEVRNSWAV